MRYKKIVLGTETLEEIRLRLDVITSPGIFCINQERTDTPSVFSPKIFKSLTMFREAKCSACVIDEYTTKYVSNPNLLFIHGIKLDLKNEDEFYFAKKSVYIKHKEKTWDRKSQITSIRLVALEPYPEIFLYYIQETAKHIERMELDYLFAEASA